MKIAAASEHARLALPPGDPREDLDVTLALGSEPAAGAAGIRWSDGAPEPEADVAARRIAPEGEGLWRRMPWPAADELFELEPPAPDAPVLVAGGSQARREELSSAIGERAGAVDSRDRLTPDALRSAGVVVLLPSPGVGGEALALETMAVLAARRLLLAPRAERRFGLMPGIDYLEFALSPEAANLLEAARGHPRAFEPLRRWGAFSARRHRASEVFAALAADLALERGALAG